MYGGVRGHPMLVESAVMAATQWRYAPVILNGEPVPVIGDVTVNYSLDGSRGTVEFMGVGSDSNPDNAK
jgi:hypothetical protein